MRNEAQTINRKRAIAEAVRSLSTEHEMIKCVLPSVVTQKLQLLQNYSIQLRTTSLRPNVAKNQTFSKYCGNSSKINSAHILMLGRP